jgi:hypothetical protein
MAAVHARTEISEPKKVFYFWNFLKFVGRTSLRNIVLLPTTDSFVFVYLMSLYQFMFLRS